MRARRSSSTVFDPAYEALAGIHKVQRVPSTEKRGRRHSSDITVIWLPEGVTSGKASLLNAAEVREDFLKTSGPGGQNKNKRETAVRLTHLPTGLQVVADGERNQGKNREAAWARLQEKLLEAESARFHDIENLTRSESFGQERNWVWTEWRDTVTSSEGRKTSYLQALRGNLGKLLSE